MRKVRSRADEARYFLARQRNAVLRSRNTFPSKEEVIAMDDPSFDDVLANVTDADLRAMDDEDAIFIAEHDPGLDGQSFRGEGLMSCLVGWDPGDVFYAEDPSSEAKQSTRGGETRMTVRVDKTTRGRPPGKWRDRASGLMAQIIHDEGLPTTQDELISKIQSRLLDDNYEVSRSSLQGQVKEAFELLRPKP